MRWRELRAGTKGVRVTFMIGPVTLISAESKAMGRIEAWRLVLEISQERVYLIDIETTFEGFSGVIGGFAPKLKVEILKVYRDD